MFIIYTYFVFICNYLYIYIYICVCVCVHFCPVQPLIIEQVTNMASEKKPCIKHMLFSIQTKQDIMNIMDDT